MTYQVVKFFTDLHDENHPYNVGDSFPRAGVSVTEGRLAELAGNHNKQGVPLIVKVEEEPKAEPKKTAKKKKAADK